MWTVLLVEDELFVRQSIRQIINWEAEGFTVIGEASNGLKAFQFIEEYQPDLVICDIMMPVMTGIELLKKVRTQGWGNRFLMLTAHTEFEYARQAVEFGATNYILKLSMSVESLIESLQKVRLELETEFKKNYSGLRESYEHCWVYILEPDRNDRYLDELVRTLDNFQDQHLMLFSRLQSDHQMDPEDILKLNIFDSDQQQPVVHSFNAMGQQTFFCWFKQNPVINNSQNTINEYSLIYSSVITPRHLIQTWREVISQLDTYWYQEMTEPIVNLKKNVIGEKRLLPWELERKMYDVFEQMNVEECNKVMEEICNYMKEHAFPMLQVKSIAKVLDQTFIKMTHLSTGHQDDIDQSISHDQLKQFMMDNMAGYLKAHISRKFKQTNHPEINKLIHFISLHYSENITVKRMAKYIRMDENYLSALFKKKTGESLIHYLHQVRIEHAEKLLIKDKDIPIFEIAERVGFVNDNYFIKIFKRYKKETPSQYRRSHLRMEDSKRKTDYESV